PLFDHLGELRRRLTVIVVALLVAALGLYFVSYEMIYILVKPILKYVVADPDALAQITSAKTMASSGALNMFDVFGGFALRFKVAFFAAIFATSPIWLWQLLAFFLPALKPKERKWVVPTLFAGVFLFIIGAVFCYFIILPPSFQWLIDQAQGFAQIWPDAKAYVNTILLFFLGFGIAFELPLIIFYLTIFNIVPYRKLRSSWRVIYIILLVVSAMVTPDANPITMILMFAAMVVLYEGSLFVSRIVLSRRIARQKAEGEYDVDRDPLMKRKKESKEDA
ncbi:MAG: twin-arginine translocase subunit TatC, partial [Coriobacteriales bacterium]|nr:twin-arginine translocase subunit TatC [Coriobacteriales bacterium]